MNRDVMPHGIVDCFEGKKQLGFVEALQVGMYLGYIYRIFSTIMTKMYFTMYPCVCIHDSITLLTLYNHCSLRPFDSIK
jgi:hypothetical protein